MNDGKVSIVHTEANFYSTIIIMVHRVLIPIWESYPCRVVNIILISLHKIKCLKLHFKDRPLRNTMENDCVFIYYSIIEGKKSSIINLVSKDLKTLSFFCLKVLFKAEN